MNVKVVCTTDDPIDSLEHHKKLHDDGFEVMILPTFRPDKAMNVDDVAGFNAYVSKLEGVSNMAIASFAEYLDALKTRHDFFASMNCSVSDHGLEHVYAEDYTDAEIDSVFDKLRSGKDVTKEENWKFKSAMLHIFASGITRRGGCNNII
jgi:glucuronate isomerase